MPAAARVAPLAGVVELADHARAHVVAPVVQLLFQLVLEQLALLFHHEDLVEALREGAHAPCLERPGHADLVQAQADVGRHRLVDAEVFQRLPRVEVGLAGAEDADARVRAVPDQPVQSVRAHVGERRVPFVVVHPRFLLEHGVGRANVQAAGRQLEVGLHDLHALRSDVHGGAGLDDVGHAFQRDPQPGVARHRPAMQAIVEYFLHRGRIENRNAAGLEDVLALVGGGGGARAMVVAGHH